MLQQLCSARSTNPWNSRISVHTLQLNFRKFFLSYQHFFFFHSSVGRLIVTKAVGFLDRDGDDDAEDITAQYKGEEGSQEERLAVFNAVRGVDKVSGTTRGLFDYVCVISAALCRRLCTTSCPGRSPRTCSWTSWSWSGWTTVSPTRPGWCWR